MAHLKLVHGARVRQTPRLAPQVPDTLRPKLTAAQHACVKVLATRLSKEFREAVIDYLVRRAWHEAYIPAYGEGVLDPFFDRMIASVTYEAVLAHEEYRAIAHVRKRLLGYAEMLNELAKKSKDAPG